MNSPYISLALRPCALSGRSIPSLPLCVLALKPQKLPNEPKSKNHNTLSLNEKYKNRLASFSKTNPIFPARQPNGGTTRALSRNPGPKKDRNKPFFSSGLSALNPPTAQMLPVVATLLPKMLPLKPLTSNSVTDVATFPTSYINHALPVLHSRLQFWKPAEGYRSPPGGRVPRRTPAMSLQRQATLFCH